MSYVKLKDLTFSVYNYEGVSLTPISWSGSALTGYKKATINAAGTFEDLQDLVRWLRFDLTIYNDSNTKVWNGFVNDIVLSLGPITVGISLEKMRNRVKIYYSYQDQFGKSISDKTTFLVDSESVARYGKKELIQSESDVDTTLANAIRQTILNIRSKPSASTSFGNGDISAKITCKGWFETTDWVYYRNYSGYEAHTEGTTAEQDLGLGFTSNRVGFNHSKKTIHELNAYLKNFQIGTRFTVSGSISNNGYKTVTGTGSKVNTIVTSNNIFTDTVDDVHDGNNGLLPFESGDMILMTGSPSALNNGFFFVNTGSANHITVLPAIISTTTGNTVSIERGNDFSIFETTVDELPSYTSPYNVTVTSWGRKLKQTFRLTNALSAWKFNKCLLKIRKIGAPSDNVIVEIGTKGSGDAYTVIDTCTLGAGSISTDSSWTAFTFGGTQTLNLATDYVIVVSRSGSDDPLNYYQIEVDETASYGNGALRLYDGSAWFDRSPKNADLLFQISGIQETSEQIKTLLTDTNQFFNSIEIVDASGISTSQYMQEDEIAGKKLLDLMKQGTSGYKRYLSFVNDQRVIRIFKEADQTLLDMRYILRTDGAIVTKFGALMEPGVLIFGESLRLDLKLQSMDMIANISSIYVEESEWNDTQNKLSITPRNDASSFKLDVMENR